MEPPRPEALPCIALPNIVDITIVPSFRPCVDSNGTGSNRLCEFEHLAERARDCLERLGKAATFACKDEASIGVDDLGGCDEQFLEDLFTIC